MEVENGVYRVAQTPLGFSVWAGTDRNSHAASVSALVTVIIVHPAMRDGRGKGSREDDENRKHGLDDKL